MGTIKTTNIEPIADNGTVTLGSSGDTFALASGVTQTIAVNTPHFYVTKSDSNQAVSHNTSTLITFNNEIRDSDNAFASNIFTVPSGKAGRYFLFACCYVGSAQDYNYFSIRKNTSTNIMNMTRYWHNAADQSINFSGIVDAAASDTFGVYLTQTSGGSKNVESNSAPFTYFGGYKIIE